MIEIHLSHIIYHTCLVALKLDSTFIILELQPNSPFDHGMNPGALSPMMANGAKQQWQQQWMQYYQQWQQYYLSQVWNFSHR